MTTPKPGTRATTGLNEGWIQGGSLIGSVLAGMLLGMLADHFLGTEPWFVVIGILLGSYSGFMKMWHYSKTLEDDPRER
ncbi:MAG: AtpZ/AtpI family protein [Acidimicrobiia bacterium]